MSQSDEHRDLVIRVAKAIETRLPNISLIYDVQQSPGEPVPPLICGYRPDVFGTRRTADFTVIGEAKTDRDLDRARTHDQMTTFVNYLEKASCGLFVLSVTGVTADRAKTLLRFMRQTVPAATTSLVVFDGFDFWLLDPGGGTTWHLS